MNLRAKEDKREDLKWDKKGLNWKFVAIESHEFEN